MPRHEHPAALATLQAPRIGLPGDVLYHAPTHYARTVAVVTPHCWAISRTVIQVGF